MSSDSMSALEHIWDKRSADWPITQDSIVWEVGGYEGRWAVAINERYHPWLYIFEPQVWAYAKILSRLGSESNVAVFNYGLGADDLSDIPMGDYGTDGASFTKSQHHYRQGTGSLRRASSVYSELGEPTIDLMLVNIEGYEYTLMPYLFQVGILPRRLMYQSHPSGDEDFSLRAAIADAGYYSLWDYGHVLSAWERPQGA